MPVQISVRVDDHKVKVALKKLGDAIPRITNKIMAQVMKDAKFDASGGWSGGASYQVPPKVGSKYQRTGTYGRSFKVVKYKPLAFRLYSDAIQNGRHYTNYVGGDSKGFGQAGVHRNRWAVIFKTVTAYAKILVAKTEMAMKKYLRQEGIGL
jgi:hypothetical protein